MSETQSEHGELDGGLAVEVAEGATDATTEEVTREDVQHGDDNQLMTSIEAVLLSSDRAVAVDRLALAFADEHAGKNADADSDAARGAVDRVNAAIDALNAAYESTGRVFRIERVAGGVRVMTKPEHALAIAAFKGIKSSSTLSRAAVETLAIVAYRQPMTRASLETIRGVACGEVLRTLLERRLIAVVGRAEELGRPMLYGTTKAFLEAFGLVSIKDLPDVEELASASGVQE